MTLQVNFFNLWALLIGFVSNMVIGALWYSPLLFGNVWLKLVGKKSSDISKSDANKAMTLSIIPAVLSVLFLYLLLAFVNASTVLDALIIGTISSFGLIGMSSLNLVLFEGRSLALAILNVGYSFVSLNVVSVIITLLK